MMFVIEVIPLTILPPNIPQILSYFLDRKLERGAVVECAIGNRKVKAVVVGSVPLNEYKMGLKKAEFQLKKLGEVLSETPQVSDRQLRMALWLSKTYYSPLGMCLKMLLPPFFLKKKYPALPTEFLGRLKHGQETTPREDNIGEKAEGKRTPLFLLTDAKNSLKNIRPLIKNAMKEQGQVALIIPDNQTLEYFYSDLAKDFEVVRVSSELNNQQTYDAWQKAAKGTVDIIVGTRQALLLPFKNLQLLIIDDPLHEAYKSDMSPKYNTADLAQYVAEANNCRLVYLSPATGVENYYLIKEKIYELMDKTSHASPIRMVNMVSEIKSGNFSLLSREVKDQMLSLVNPTEFLGRLKHGQETTPRTSQNKNILIFSPRRGHSGVLICENCGYTAKCPNCDIAYRIHRAEELILICHHCGSTQRLPNHCSNCNSSKLKPTGPAGSQKIYEEVRRILSQNLISGVPVLILDADVTANPTEEEEVMSEIAKPKTSILIATQMIFSYRYDHNFDFVAVMNADSLVQVPDFRTEERLFYQMEKLLDFGPKQVMVQTFNPENPVFDIASQRNYKDFYESELLARKAFSYPPFSRLIKLTFRHPDREKASREARILSGKLKMAAVHLGLSDKIKISDSSPGYTEKERGLYTYNIIIKSLVGPTPREILKYVPSRWLIDVDPRSLL